MAHWRRSARSPLASPAIRSPPPGSCPAFRSAHSTVGSHRPNACPSYENPSRPRSNTPRPSHPCAMRRTDRRAPAPPHRTNPTWRGDGARLDAEPVSAADPDAPPAASRFCAQTAASIPGNNRVSPPCDRHGQAQPIAHPEAEKRASWLTPAMFILARCGLAKGSIFLTH